MTSSKPLQLRLSDPIRQALDAHCDEHGVELSAVIREAICEKLGQPELLETMRSRGQPKKEGKNDELYHRFLDGLRGKVLEDPDLNRLSWRPDKVNRLEAASNGLFFNFIATDKYFRVQLYLQRETLSETYDIYNVLWSKHQEIQAICGEPLRWKGEVPSKKQPTIELPVSFERLRDEAKWDTIQHKMVSAMVRFRSALEPHLKVYRTKRPKSPR